MTTTTITNQFVITAYGLPAADSRGQRLTSESVPKQCFNLFGASRDGVACFKTSKQKLNNQDLLSSSGNSDIRRSTALTITSCVSQGEAARSARPLKLT